MKRAQLIAISLCTAFCLAAAQAQATSRETQSSSLDPETAEADAARDSASGQCLLYAVQGYNWEIPKAGMSIKDAGKLYTLIYIMDTSDAVTAETREANARARTYAGRYNSVAIKTCGRPK